MADVKRRDRGQIILIVGLAVALTFVVLTLLINTVIYTENLASRSTDIGGGEAIEYQQSAVTGVGGLVDEENRNEYTDHENVRENVSAGIDEIDRLVTLQLVQQSSSASSTNVTLHNGSLLRQTDDARNMTSGGGGSPFSANWTLAKDISNTRQYSMTVSGDLEDTSSPETEAFAVVLEESSGVDTWELYVYNDSGSGVPKLAVKNGTQSTPTRDVCSASVPSTIPFTMNLTAGTVEGESCPTIQFAKGIQPPYDVKYRYGNRSAGTYNLTVNVTGSSSEIEDGNFHDVGAGDSPYHVPAVYSTSFEVTYRTARITYRNRVRAAPGEPE